MFDLSYRKTLTCDMGQLIPIVCDEMVPGDLFELGNEIVVRYQPLVAPILHEVNVYTHYYFVPYRLLWNQWEEFITGGADGQSSAVLPRWSPTNNAEGSLWDYLGLPTGVVPTDALPVDFIRRAYNFIYNNYYRDENLQTAVAETNEAILSGLGKRTILLLPFPGNSAESRPLSLYLVLLLLFIILPIFLLVLC